MKLEFKEGDYVAFPGMSTMIYGCVCRIHDDHVDYIRDSLTRWSASKSMIEKGALITEDRFIGLVQESASKSGYGVPSAEEIKYAISLFKGDFDIELSTVYNVLNITKPNRPYKPK